MLNIERFVDSLNCVATGDDVTVTYKGSRWNVWLTTAPSLVTEQCVNDRWIKQHGELRQELVEWLLRCSP